MSGLKSFSTPPNIFKNILGVIRILIPSKENFILIEWIERETSSLNNSGDKSQKFIPVIFTAFGIWTQLNPLWQPFHGFNSHVYVNGFIMIHSYLTRISLFAATYKPYMPKVHHYWQYLHTFLITLVFLLMMGAHNRLWIMLAVLLVVYTITSANEYCNEKPWACCNGDSSIKPGKVQTTKLEFCLISRYIQENLTA